MEFGGSWFVVRGRRFLCTYSTTVQYFRFVVHVQMCSKQNIRRTTGTRSLARVSKYAGGRPRLASVAFDGRYMGLAL